MFLRVEVVEGVRHDVPRVDRLLQRVRDARHRHRPSEPILSTAKKSLNVVLQGLIEFGFLVGYRIICYYIGRVRVSGRIKPGINLQK